MRNWKRGGVTVAIAALVLAGCSDDDRGDGDRADGTPAACGTTDVTATFPGGDEVALDQSYAQTMSDGLAYTVFAGDFDLLGPEGQIAETPEDGHVALMALGSLLPAGAVQPIEEGATIEWSSEPEALTFNVTFNEGITASANPAGAEGTLKVVELKDDSICLQVDYSDDEKSLVGTISADIVQPTPRERR